MSLGTSLHLSTATRWSIDDENADRSPAPAAYRRSRQLPFRSANAGSARHFTPTAAQNRPRNAMIVKLACSNPPRSIGDFHCKDCCKNRLSRTNAAGRHESGYRTSSERHCLLLSEIGFEADPRNTVVSVGIVRAQMYAPRFSSAEGCFDHDPRDHQHVL